MYGNVRVDCRRQFCGVLCDVQSIMYHTMVTNTEETAACKQNEKQKSLLVIKTEIRLNEVRCVKLSNVL